MRTVPIFFITMIACLAVGCGGGSSGNPSGANDNPLPGIDDPEPASRNLVAKVEAIELPSNTIVPIYETGIGRQIDIEYGVTYRFVFSIRDEGGLEAATVSAFLWTGALDNSPTFSEIFGPGSPTFNPDSPLTIATTFRDIQFDAEDFIDESTGNALTPVISMTILAIDGETNTTDNHSALYIKGPPAAIQ